MKLCHQCQLKKLGMNNSAYAGAEFLVTKSENEAKELVEFKKMNSANNKLAANDKTTLFDNVKVKENSIL